MESQWTLKKMPEHNNNISLEQYQQSIALMNSDLCDIQEDIQKLAEQQNQIQVQTMQAQQLLQAQQIANILNQQYSSQQNITGGLYHPIQQQFGSTPQLSMSQKQQQQQQLHQNQYINEQGQYVTTPMKGYSRENSRLIEDQYSSPPPSQFLNQEKQNHIQKYVQETNHFRDQFDNGQQFYLHGKTEQNPQTPPQAPARRTWSQKPPPEMSSWSQQAQQQTKYDTWKSPPQSGGFVLHSHQNNGRESMHTNEAQRLFPVHQATPPKTPQSNNLQPSDDMMAPQSISFIADEDDADIDEADNYIRPMPRRNGSSSVKKSFDQIGEFETSLGKLNITSGSRTYRIPSPTTRQGIADNSFQSMESQNENEKGFYISFDTDVAPKRPKPPLRTKKSPKKSNEELNESLPMSPQEEFNQKKLFSMQGNHNQSSSSSNDSFKPKIIEQNPVHQKPQPQPRISSTPKESQAIVISDNDPVSF